MKQIKKPAFTMAALSIFMLSFGAHAQTTTQTETQQQQYVVPAAGSGGNAADAARKAERTQLVTAAVNVGAGAMFTGVCATVYGSWACPLAGMALVAASMMGRAASGSNAAGYDMSAYDPNYGGQVPVDQWGNPVGNNGTTGGTGNGIGANAGGGGLPDGTTSQTIQRDVARLTEQLEKSGVKIDGNTMTLKNGRKFDLSKGGDGSQSGLMAMGLTADEAAQAMAAGKKYSDQAAAKYAGMLKGDVGGGGGGGMRGPAAEDAAGGARGFKWGDPRAQARKVPQVSGLTKKLGDDTIGVSGDNIFEMVTRRYKARDTANNFLKD